MTGFNLLTPKCLDLISLLSPDIIKEDYRNSSVSLSVCLADLMIAISP